MEAGLIASTSASQPISFNKVFREWFPYYLSIGMTPDEYWNADPELAAAYRQAEQLRVQKKQEELWCGGIYMMRAIAACLSKDVSYFDEPLSTTREGDAARAERQKEHNLELAKARFESWAFSQ